jgi:D-amino peptidase
MHVAVFADIEGSFGIWRMRQCRMGTGEWQYGRSCLTDDVNHMIHGAFDGGAKRVTVKDIHESGFNCLIDRLDRRASYVGGHFIKPTFFGDVQNYDLVLFAAIHAASGTIDSFFPHTHYGIFSEVRINGKPVCEMDIYGAYLGEFGVPIGFVSGEDIAVRQALDALPWAKSVVVDKREETYTSGSQSIEYLSKGRGKLRAAAAEAVRHVSDMKPLVLSGPLHFEVTFRSEKLADRYNTWDFDQEGTIITWDADTMIEGFEKLNKITFFPKSIYPVRRQMMFCMRVLYRLKNTFFAPKPNPEGAALKN